MALPQNEFFEANRGRIEGLIDQIDNFIDNNRHATIQGIDANNYIDVVHLEGMLSTEECIDNFFTKYGHVLSVENAQALAEYENNNQLSLAATSIGSLQAVATEWETAEEASGIDPTDEEAIAEFNQKPAVLLGFDQAIWQQSKALGQGGERMALTRIVLSGLEHYGAASNYRVNVDDGTITQHTLITKVGGKTPEISTNIEASKNPLLERLTQSLGRRAVNSLIPALVGRFRDEEQLDDLFSEVWTEAQGTAHEEEVTPLLDEVRIQAQAQKQANSLNIRHSISQPSDDQFSDLEQILNGMVS